jgi:hypothetical protein
MKTSAAGATIAHTRIARRSRLAAILARRPATCAIIGSSQGVTFDGCMTCDTCMASKCCAETTTCFSKTADGGQTDCEQLFDCVAACDAADGGDTCVAACAQAHPDGVQPAQALQTCQQNGCSGTDGGTAECE